MQPRMNRRDQAELLDLLSPYFKKKRKMFPKGHRPVFWLDSEPIEPVASVVIRLVDRANGKKMPKTTHIKKRAKKPSGDLETIKTLPISELGLKTRTFNCLTKKAKKIKTIGDLLTLVFKKTGDLMQIPEFGVGCLIDCENKLRDMGL
jgi:hypothetical protein